MRLLVLFDLPMITSSEKRVYSQFRRFLLKNGYIMMQFSVYSRLCRNCSDIAKHINRLRKNAPDSGNVRIIKVTEKQYEDMVMLVGSKKDGETDLGTDPLMVIE